jgi:hypothetical protein
VTVVGESRWQGRLYRLSNSRRRLSTIQYAYSSRWYQFRQYPCGSERTYHRDCQFRGLCTAPNITGDNESFGVCKAYACAKVFDTNWLYEEGFNGLRANRIRGTSSLPIRAIVLSPTRELGNCKSLPNLLNSRRKQVSG